MLKEKYDKGEMGGCDRNDILLSVIIPAYNESATICEVLSKVLAEPTRKEVVVVDDGSEDDTVARVNAFDDDRIRLLKHDMNMGKGAAVCTGFSAARGRYVLVQDADLEYDTENYPALLDPVLSGRADVVYGSRFLGGPHRVLYFWHFVANKLLTLWSDMFSNLNLSDMETGYKLFKREVVEELRLKEKGFGIEPEITQKIGRRNWRICEVPISYYGRTYEEGKKIGLKDAIWAFWCVVRYCIKD